MLDQQIYFVLDKAQETLRVSKLHSMMEKLKNKTISNVI